jgi:hypothetical protein
MNIIQVNRTFITIGGVTRVTIDFDSVERTNGFLLDYISKRGQEVVAIMNIIQVNGTIITIGGVTIDFDSIERANDFLLGYISKYGQEVVSVPVSAKVEDSTLKGLVALYGDIEIENLGLSVRSYNCLKRAGINTVEDVLKLDYNAVTRIRNLGRHSILEIQDNINDFVRIDYIDWASQVPYSDYEEVR